MVSKVLLISAVIAYVEARFGQENVPIAAISSVQGGDPGAAATVAGATISDLLGGANSCAKLQRADQIVSELGGGADAIAAAIGLVAAEKNTNPFANGNVQNVCGDPSLPVTAELRGITPLIDPDVDINGDAAALSASSSANPLNADGLSVFDLMSQAGLGDLVASQAAGGGAAAGGNAGGSAGGNAGDNAGGNAGGNAEGNAGGNNQEANNQQNSGNGNGGNNNQQGAGNAGNQQANDNNQQAGESGNQNSGNANNSNQNAVNDSGNQNAGNNTNQGQGQNQNQSQSQDQNQNGGNNNQQDAGNANQDAAGGAADFGQCTPTIDLQGGRNGRPADELTFQITDPLARGGQSEALNPNIITNALCNQLTNVCDANAAAVAACEDAKAQVEAAGTRDQSTVDLFNSALGFGGAAKKRGMRRGLRL